MSDLIPYAFEGRNVLRVVNREGEPWFVLADLCRTLELTNPYMVGLSLDADEKMTLSLTEGHSGQRGGAQSVLIINESGLWAVMLKSVKPVAKRLRRWLTNEVIPSIRKTGDCA